jgi:hypothetical protein
MTIFNRLLPVFVAYVLCSGTMGAAEIRTDPSYGVAGGVVLEGTIDAGDFEKFKNFILNSGNAVEIYLASPGGDLIEAMKIGFVVRLLKLSTVVPGKTLTNQALESAATEHNLKNAKMDYMCTSACFFIFVAGVHRTHDDRGPALLGIHKPSLTAETLKKLSPDQAVAAAEKIRTTVENYLKAMGVPEKYARNMYFEPKRSVEWVRNDEFEADFDGFIPEFRDRVSARCDKPSDMEKKDGQTPKNKTGTVGTQEAQRDCTREAQADLAHRALSEMFKRQNGETFQVTPNVGLPDPSK